MKQSNASSIFFSCVIIIVFTAGFAQAQRPSLKAYAYYKRGVTYDDKAYYYKAISDFTKAIQIDPSYAMAYYNRGITYFLKKEYNIAWNDINKVQEIGTQIHPVFLEMLREDSGRER